MPLTDYEKARITQKFRDLQQESAFLGLMQFVTGESAKDEPDMAGLHGYLVQQFSDIIAKRCAQSTKMRERG